MAGFKDALAAAGTKTTGAGGKISGPAVTPAAPAPLATSQASVDATDEHKHFRPGPKVGADWAVYRTTMTPTQSIWLCGKEYKAANHVISLPPDAAKELELMRDPEGMYFRPDVASAYVRLQSMEAAEAIAKKHMADNFRPAAVRGMDASLALPQQDRDESKADTNVVKELKVELPDGASDIAVIQAQGNSDHLMAAAEQAKSTT